MERLNHSAGRKRLRQMLRKIRLDAGLRQADLAARLGQPQSFVSKCENGERKLDVIELKEVCECCGITLAQLVELLESDDAA